MEPINGTMVKELLRIGADVVAQFVESENEGDRYFTMVVRYRRDEGSFRQAVLHGERGNLRRFRGCRSLVNYPRRLGIRGVEFVYKHAHEIKI